MTENLKEVVYGQNEFIIEEGEESKSFYIILDGTCECLKYYEDDQKKGYLRVRELKTRDHFGEVGILNHQPRSMSIRVTSHKCKLVKMSKEIFSRLVFSIETKLNKEYNMVFDNKVREILESNKAHEFPLDQVFPDYNLKYIEPLGDVSASEPEQCTTRQSKRSSIEKQNQSI